MKLLKVLFKGIIILVSIILLYFVTSLLLSSITINKEHKNNPTKHWIYLSTNGVHLDIVIPKEKLISEKFKKLNFNSTEKYLSFGWGDENFYINTPTWADLTFENGFRALFLKSSSLVHVTRYKSEKSDWVKVYVSEKQLKELNQLLSESFKKNNKNEVIRLNNIYYTTNDDFYKANGSYSMFYSCNSWVNNIFKDIGLKSCYWTPFDFPLLNKYE